MEHRAQRPLVAFWRRLPRATAHRLGLEAAPGRTRVLASVVIALTLGIGGYAGVASLTGGSGSTQAESSAPAAAPGSPLPTEPLPESDSPEPPASDDEAPAPSSGKSRAPSPTSDPSPSVPAPLDEVTRPLGAGSATSSASPSTPDPATPDPSAPSPSAPAEDDTAPSTTLSADYPEPHAAEFSFSADEDASFTCSLDGAAFVPCGASRMYSDLAPGWHTFAVRATDTAGNADRSPAETRWKAKNAHAGEAGGG